MDRNVEICVPIHASSPAAARLLANDPMRVLTDHVRDVPRVGRQCVTSLPLPLGAGTAVLQDVLVELGPAQMRGDGGVLPLSLRPVSHEWALPIFTGELELSTNPSHGHQLCLRGAYVVPFGPVGRFGDGLFGQRLVRRSLTEFMADVVERLETALVVSTTNPPRTTATYAPDLREYR